MGIADNNWWETRVWRGKGTNLNGSIDDHWSLIFTSCSSLPFSSWHAWESYSVVPPSARLSLPSYAPHNEEIIIFSFPSLLSITHSQRSHTHSDDETHMCRAPLFSISLQCFWFVTEIARLSTTSAQSSFVSTVKPNFANLIITFMSRKRNERHGGCVERRLSS